MKKLLLLPPQLGFPPGYITPRSYQNVVGSFTRKNYMGTQNTWEDLMEGRFILAGSPTTVREQLTYILKELGTGIMLCLFQIGSMPHDLALKSMHLFATEVMPQVQAEIDRSLSHRLGAATAALGSQEARV
jgi:alkanesulfonate monooxygenase SsuD/methylene tetrahydromethanopterin reductase-like flavin-dependent oxidoreductase (luciferase family)